MSERAGQSGDVDASPDWLPQRGERAIAIGQTGSGKTTFITWLLQRTLNTPTVIYDTKDEPKFLDLPRVHLATDLRSVVDGVDNGESDFIVFRPHVELLADPQALDALLLFHYNHLRGVDAYIDELYTFHNHGQAGTGLTALYTRGRSRGITTISSTQRPAWISQFSMSEAQLFYLFHLNSADDRKKVSKASGMPEMANPPRHHFYVYRSGEDAARLVKPVSVDGAKSHGYVDEPASEPDAQDESPIRRHLWL